MIVAQRDTHVVESAWIFLTYIAAHIIFFSSDSRCEQRSERDKLKMLCYSVLSLRKDS